MDGFTCARDKINSAVQRRSYDVCESLPLDLQRVALIRRRLLPQIPSHPLSASIQLLFHIQPLWAYNYVAESYRIVNTLIIYVCPAESTGIH